MTATDYDRLDAFDSPCLRNILGIRWQDLVTNAEMRHRTQQPLASITLKASRLSLFGHASRLPPTSDTRMALTGALAPPRKWKWPRGRPRNTWLFIIKDVNIGLFFAVQKDQDREGWRSITHRATLSWEQSDTDRMPHPEIIVILFTQHNYTAVIFSWH